MELTYIERLIAKELLGESLDTEEQQTLENWLKQSAENKAMYERIRQNQFSRSHYESYFQINEKEAFQQFLKQTKKSSFSKTYIRNIAACLIPLLIVGSALWINYHKTTLKESTNTAAIIPGGTMATLHTATGEEFILNKETLVQHTNTTAFKTTPKGISLNSKNKKEQTQNEPFVEQRNAENELRTANNGEFIITLEDGTTVHLNYNTTLRYPEHFSDKERIVYLEGEAFFNVAKDTKRPFKVITRNLTLRQYGTSFNVNTYSDNYTEVVLVEGSIGVINGTHEYILKPNEMACFHHQTSQLHINTVDVETHIAWHNGRFIFDNERLDDIMETLSHWYNVKVKFDDPKLKELHFTGNIDRYGNLAPILKSISQTVGLRMVIKKRIIYIYKQ